MAADDKETIHLLHTHVFFFYVVTRHFINITVTVIYVEKDYPYQIKSVITTKDMSVFATFFFIYRTFVFDDIYIYIYIYIYNIYI